MSIFGRRRGPTHEDALQASRRVMEKALTGIAFFGNDEESARIAAEALAESKRVYTAGVMAAVD